MKEQKFSTAFLTLFLLFLGIQVSNAATLSLDLDIHFANGLDGVGVSSVGGLPFSLLAQDERIGLFGAELSLAGVHVPVTLEGASVTVVPIPAAVWLFASGVMGLLGVGYRKGVRAVSFKPASQLSLLFVLVLVSPFGFAALDSNADLNGDAMVTSQDISKLASCFGQNPASNADCAKADVDEDGDIDRDDFSFVSARMGEAYPEILFHDQFPQKFGTSEWPISVTIGDVNGDAVLDVVTGNGAAIRDSKVSVLLGNGDGSFQAQQNFAVDGYPYSVVLGDVNGDAVLDLVTANGFSEDGEDVSVLLGNGDGSFQVQQRFAVNGYPYSVALGDVNGDAVLDMVTGNQNSYGGDNKSNVSVLLGNGDGTFQAQQQLDVGYYPRSVALGDLNGDAVLDLLATHRHSNEVSVLLGNGDGSFLAPQHFAVGDNPNPVVLGDLNDDAVLDLITANQDSSDVSVLLGNGDGTFQAQQRFAVGGYPYSVALGDVNGDAVIDVVTANSNDSVSVLLGNGNGSFQAQLHFAVSNFPFSVVLGDVNGDTALDVVTATADTSNVISVLLGNGDGSFQAQQGFVVGDQPSSVALGDVNGDTMLDVVTANWASNDISVLLGNGDGTFQAQQRFAVGIGASSVALGDVNGDTVIDVVTVNQNSSDVSVLLGNGDGSFQVEQRFAVDGFPFLVALDYVNGDAVLDVVTANSNSVSVLLGNGDGTFQAQERFSVGDDTMQLIALGDINGDAVLDVLMANALYDGDMSVFLGNGDGSFLAPQSFAIDNTPESVALGDVNGDAVLDLVTINNMQPSYVSVSLGNGDGSFQVQQSFTVSSYPGFIALGYVNGDTALDLVTVSGFSNDVSVLLNRLVETPD
jgi:hypothetical protein